MLYFKKNYSNKNIQMNFDEMILVQKSFGHLNYECGKVFLSLGLSHIRATFKIMQSKVRKYWGKLPIFLLHSNLHVCEISKNVLICWTTIQMKNGPNKRKSEKRNAEQQLKHQIEMALKNYAIIALYENIAL